jgi:Translation initiation factor 3 (IF-3)
MPFRPSAKSSTTENSAMRRRNRTDCPTKISTPPELKQVQLTPQIGQHDLETKARHAREFIEDGNKVQVSRHLQGPAIGP